MSGRRTGLALAALLLGALALRLWNLDHGLPFAYNADEAEHFVPLALDIAGGGGLDPGYYENPPALTYLLALVYRIGGDADAFLTGRVVVALIGTGVAGLTAWAGARAFSVPAGAVAGALMAVAFLPVFYSKHALNDVVTLAPVTLALIASLAVWRRGSWPAYAAAGAAVGAATATKYTAGAMLLTIALAAALRLLADRGELRRVVLGLAAAGAAFAAVFLVLDPWALLEYREFRRQLGGQSAQAESGKLGQDDTLGWLYYAGTLGWGLGWAAVVAAAGGAVVVLRRDRRLALLLLAFPVFLWLFLGGQGRYFARWLLPAYPMLCVLAGIGVVAAAEALRRPALLVPVLAAVVCLQGLVESVQSAVVLGREDTRAQALRWLGDNVPAGSRIVVEPFVPAAWASRYDKWPVPRPFQAYEKNLRVRDIERYRAGGYCTVVVGSHQKDRGLKAGLRSARRYYPALRRASAEVVTFSPYRAGAEPVGFSYDKSFNYQPRAYERPGPVVEIFRLRDCG